MNDLMINDLALARLDDLHRDAAARRLVRRSRHARTDVPAPTGLTVPRPRRPEPAPRRPPRHRTKLLSLLGL